MDEVTYSVKPLMGSDMQRDPIPQILARQLVEVISKTDDRPLLLSVVFRKSRNVTRETLRSVLKSIVENCCVWVPVRFVFWNTCLNSIIVDRTLACVGELCWCAQFALALSYLDQSISKKKTCWIQVSSILAVLVYVAAECTSYYNVATTNELWCAIEVILDAVSFVCMFPGYVHLWIKCPGSLRTSSAKRFLAITAVLCVVYPVYNFAIDAPMYMKRYRVDQENHKEYFSFWIGLKDAAIRRVPTHKFGDWSEDMTWMTLYFSFGAWSGLLLMDPPRLRQDDGDLTILSHRSFGLRVRSASKKVGFIPLNPASDCAGVRGGGACGCECGCS
eukprot:g4230.t1